MLALCGLVGVASATPRPPTVTTQLSPSVPSPSLLDTKVTWTATVLNGVQGHTYDYRFTTALNGQVQIVKDFNTPNTFVWVPWQVEGTYTVSVVTRDITAQPIIVYPPVSAQYRINPIVTAQGQSAVNMTAHALVALFSAGPCTIGHSIRVRFHANGSQATSVTNSVPCSASSANFLVAGMTPSSEYQMHWEEFATNYLNSGPDLGFTTGHLPSGFPRESFQVNVPPTQHDSYFPVVFYQLIPGTGGPFTLWPTATDLAGNVVWYFPAQAFVTRTEPGGNFFTMSNLLLSEYDLAGNKTLETNAEILNEQLVAKGYPPMTSFNAHETRRLPNGNILLLVARDEASTQYQGGTQNNPVDILGDMVLILDHNMQLVWAWDSFAHEDLSRTATLNEKCAHGAEGCPLFSNQFQTCNDWLHSNSVQLTADGNILLSQRNQDWVLKINYANGTGDGRVLWRMGPYGDFTIVNPPQTQCGDPNVYPWFTHQHDASYQQQNNAFKTMTVFDDGNLRVSQCGTGNSRGMVFSVSEATHTVYIQTAADLKAYSAALGSAQLLAAPGYPLYASFGNGFLSLPSNQARATETDLSGNIVYELQASWLSYRSYRMQDMYTSPNP